MVSAMTTYPTPRAYYVIACGAAKATQPTRAADLYVSPTFRNTLAKVTAEAALDDHADVLILSARHGLLHLDQVVAPYDQRIDQPGRITAAQLAAQIADLDGNTAGATLYGFLPRAYLRLLAEAVELVCDEADDDVVTVQDVYEAAPGIGHQRGVLAILARS